MSDSSLVINLIVLLSFFITWPIGLYLTYSGGIKYNKLMGQGQQKNSVDALKQRNKFIFGIAFLCISPILSLILSVVTGT